MNTTGRWLARIGAIVIVVGFLLPSVAVSCTVLPGVQNLAKSESMFGIASAFNQPLLYMVPLGALAILIIGFLTGRNRGQELTYLLGQVFGLAVGALGILLVVAFLSNSAQQAGFAVSGDFGLYALILGYALVGAGIVVQYSERRTRESQAPAQVAPAEAPPPPPPAATPMASLQIVRGGHSGSLIPVQDNLFIGRAAENHVQLPDDLSVSRRHARIRYGQGAWFIQDQNSDCGTFVNGRRVPAVRLHTGDQIRIGDTVFIFRS